jgi:hypothetical protein
VNRRGFLSALFGGAAAAATLDPERLLWVPGAKTISIPKPRIRERVSIDSSTGIRIRHVQHYDVSSGLIINRFDVLMGFASINPQPFKSPYRRNSTFVVE